MAKPGKVRAQLVELYSRVIKIVSTKDKIYNNGENNLYPYEIDRAINNSPTATRASDIMAKFISGKGVEGDVVVNKKKNLNLSDFVGLVAEDIANQSGCFIWIGYGINKEGKIVPKTPDVLDYSNCRITKEDDNEYPGRVFYKDYSHESASFTFRNDTEKKWYYPFNPNPEIVKAQMKTDAKDKYADIEKMVRSYRGQVLYLNLTPRYKYALSKFDSVFNDMDSEYRFSLYVNTQMRTGFLGKTAVITQGLDEQDKKREKQNLQKWLGAENSGSLYHLNVDQVDDLEKVLKVVQPKAQIDDKLFVENDKRIRRNILGAANNLPEPLIYAGEGALFGTSGETYREMKLFYQEQTQKERTIIEKTLERLGFETKIIPIVEENVDTEV